ncbi:MAG: STAS-like domain-containing protein [Bacillota bacterium]|nr:STAS-like domain-containing protein [Bacillota bacterium]
MRFSMEMQNEIEKQILLSASIRMKSSDIVQNVSKKFDISTRTVNKYIEKLFIQKRLIKSSKEGKDTIYSPKYERNFKSFELKDFSDESIIWTKYLKEVFLEKNISRNLINALDYGMTEMINNVIDHSEAKLMNVTMALGEVDMVVMIEDDGVGIFNKLCKELDLGDIRYALMELYKGKVTSDPLNHTGEGIFFTSRLFDKFFIVSENLVFHGHKDGDEIFNDDEINAGTRVIIKQRLDMQRTVMEVFNEFSDPDAVPGFFRTVIDMKKFILEGESLVSRSQAKRFVKGFEKFLEVVLDFRDIEFVGQGFADQIFRVFTRENPKVEIIPINMNADVEFMIKRAARGSSDNL